jgi:hypothetical protein
VRKSERSEERFEIAVWYVLTAARVSVAVCRWLTTRPFRPATAFNSASVSIPTNQAGLREMPRALRTRITHQFCAEALGVLSLLVGLVSAVVLLRESSARTPATIFAASTLYRAAVRARFEFFSSDCLGL